MLSIGPQEPGPGSDHGRTTQHIPGTDAEIEAASPSCNRGSPSLDDGTGETIVPAVPVQGLAFRPKPNQDAPQDGPRDPAAKPSEPPATDAPSPDAPRKSVRLGRLLYWSVDTLLWLSTAFAWAAARAPPPDGRNRHRHVMISLIAPYVLPLLSRRAALEWQVISAPHDSVKSSPPASNSRPGH